MRLLLHLLLILCYSTPNAQIFQDTLHGPNLITNPGFEQLRRPLVKNDLDGSVSFRNCLAGWMSPTQTTPDLLFAANDYSSDQPHSGKATAAILTHNPQSKRSNFWREYIQTKLAQPLQAGHEYELAFWVRRHSLSAMASNNIGAFLGNAPLVNPNFNPLFDLQPIFNETAVINPEQNEWVQLTTKFTASGKEAFLVIGNFFNNKQTTFVDVKIDGADAFQNAYYLVDDVRLNQILPKVQPEPVVAQAPVLSKMEPKVGQVIRLDRIYFAFDKWDLLPESFTQLDELKRLMDKYPEMTIFITGHTDSRGSDSYNFLLSKRRSNAVFEHMVSQGIDESRIEYKGFGETSPVADNATDAGRQSNRRVEFEVLSMGDENVQVEQMTISEQ